MVGAYVSARRQPLPVLTLAQARLLAVPLQPEGNEPSAVLTAKAVATLPQAFTNNRKDTD
jgi:hypothetical protein